MYDPSIPPNSTGPMLSDPARYISIVLALQLAVITRLALERNEAQRIADTRLGALELLEEADRTCAYWRTRALHAEELARELERARSTHVCRDLNSKEN